MQTQETSPAYRVLARKYRPRDFSELIGQDALVRTLKNAIDSGRIAHAYMLTGVRGVGKTTTARIIARALNYTGADGKAGPTTGPTDDCATCRSIAEGSHPDVLEMDAATNNSVEDVREILDGVRYAPTSARYKVYIIDEVHMLSKQAFNALLKTLEEPPPRTIFIFATTEIRKVPVTVLSRCQRFDLRRVDAATLSAYYAKICGLEKVKAEDEALTLIARAADGSVRDGLSLLDQAIARGGDAITALQVRDMLGLADRLQVLDLLESAIRGDTARALEMMNDMYRSGADTVVLMQDMLDFTHLLTRLRAVPDQRDLRATLGQDAGDRITALAASLSMPTLGRTWQILLKGLGEINAAPNPQAAAEMIVIRLSYAAGLPDPADLLKKLQNGEAVSAGAAPARAAAEARRPEPVAMRTIQGGGGATAAQAVSIPALHAEPASEAAAAIPAQSLASLTDIESALRANRDIGLASEVYQFVHLVKLEPRRLEIRIESAARPTLSNELATALKNLTGEHWFVTVAQGQAGAPTLAEQKAAVTNGLIDQARTNPIVAEVLRLFPGTEISVKQDN